MECRKIASRFSTSSGTPPNGELRDASGKVVARVTMKVIGIASDGTAEGKWGLFEDQLYKAK